MRPLQSLAMGLALTALSCATLPAQADSDTNLEYNRLERPSNSIGSLGSELLGDSVDLYSGAGSFDVTDISIPGNSKLPVSLGRHLNVGTSDLYGGLPSFGNWEIDVPYITGYFSEAGWEVVGDGNDPFGTVGTANRCSVNTYQGGIPPAVVRNGGFLYGINYWSGNQMYVPGAGTQEMLVNNTDGTSPKPSSGPAAHWVTKSLWTFSCLPTVTGGPGEGFLATSPEGPSTTSIA